MIKKIGKSMVKQKYTFQIMMKSMENTKIKRWSKYFVLVTYFGFWIGCEKKHMFNVTVGVVLCPLLLSLFFTLFIFTSENFVLKWKFFCLFVGTWERFPKKFHLLMDLISKIPFIFLEMRHKMEIALVVYRVEELYFLFMK